ncbi:tRNA3(Ser)-specific nuclease WapA precursor [Oxobacter pfennigii]|uniref:tRNA3(Ser)-specific nuclease WapA n=1 Tax=Oxobacter pfennigii TaxID=36849 RepID=A0A0P8W898_9CLOT|nr:hypothetical protein [Oxobacter pfennigii]KPU44236.1 tRNA3(Ser)-specific nuclease WapA precursor [Oxobacter pfennigii]
MSKENLRVNEDAKYYRQKNRTRITELNEKRNQHAKYYLNNDGTITAEISANSRHYKDKNGKWQDISNEIASSSDEKGFNFSNKANSFKTDFAKNSASGQLAALRLDKNQKISWNMADVNSVDAVNDTFSVTYPEILSDVDLKYVTFSDGLKENIILKSPDAANSYTFNFMSNGLLPEKQNDGSIALKDENTGEAVLVIPKPYMFDGKNESSQDISMEIETGKNPDEFTVTVTADPNWLKDPSRAYPVTVDPTITTYNWYTQVGSNGVDTFIAEGTNYSYYVNELLRQDMRLAHII